MTHTPNIDKIDTLSSTAWFSFESYTLHIDHDEITRADYDSISRSLPMTGCAWIEGGHMFIQQRDGAIAWDLGPVAVSF